MKKLLLFLAALHTGWFTHAATFTVTNSADSGAGSLRAALTSANSTAGTDAIVFSGVSGILTLASPLPSPTDDLSIAGPGSGVLTISGNSQFQILNVPANRRVTIGGLKFSGGKVVDSPGGAIANAGFLTISDCIFESNTATINASTTTLGAYGGALWSTGSLTVLRCQFTSNSANGGFTSGDSLASRGGAIYCAGGSLTVESCAFSGNTAVGRNGLSTQLGNFGPGASGLGGAIYLASGSASVLRSSFSTNDATGGTGGSRMGSGGQGGGGAFGGAIYQAAGASLLEDCSFTGNRARGGSGGQGLGAILMVPNPGGPGGGASGGAIVNGGGSGMQLNRCTLSVNAASGGSAGFPSGTSAVSGAGSGGAILGTGTFTNCTVSQNAASGTNANGGGISASAGTILHCTIVANSAASAGGVTSGPSLKNTLVTGNTPADSAGAVNSLGHNLFGTSAGITGLDASDLRDVAALLGPLQDNGGPTMTYALLANSPALNAGDNTGAPASDQRGESRPQGATVDIGAFEASALAILVGGKPALPGAYTRTSPATVSFETIFPASAIRYTLDGSTPTLASTPYTAPFSVAATQTIRAAAFDAGLANPVFAGPVLLSFGPARTLTLNTTGLGAIVRSPTSEAYPDGAVVSLTAIPIAGWLFQGWSGDIAGNASPTTVTMNSNKTIQATFVPGPSYSLSVTPAGQGTVSFDPPGGVYLGGTVITFTATPASGWKLSAWGGDLSGASSPIGLTIDGNKSVTATFTQLPTYSVAVTQFGQGTISLNPPGGVYSVGTPVEMLATAADGWVFNGYSSAASGTNPRVNFVMNGNKPVTASFRPDPLAHSIPGTAAISEFGTSVAISGTRMVVGSRELGKACVYDLASATPLLPVVTLNKPVPSVNDQFGEKVAIFGTRVVVAAQSNNTGATAAGAVYVYDLGSSTPAVPVIMLSNPTPRTYENFGWSVAVDGTRVVVGSPFDDMAGPNSGSAYVYDLTSATPNVPVATLPNPTPAVSDYFGQSVAISGSRVVVGAYLDDTGASNAGSAYAYDLAGATPAVPVATFNNPTPVANGYFGLSVAISGARIVVGASNNNNGEGRAYVYDFGSATPSVPVVTLNNPTPSSYDYFGYSVAISGPRIVVGADYDDTVAANAGSAYVFDLNGSAPTVPVMTVSDPLALPDDNFGSATAIDGTTIAVGAPHADPSGPSSGAVYTYSILSNDADNDGLSDSWELLYWPTVAGHAANDDSDGDGFTELQELAFSLNPLVPDSGIQPKPVAEGGYLTITLIKQPWVTYEVQSAGTLLPGQPESFSPATTTILMNNSTTLKVRDNFLFGTPPGRFMRVKVLAAP